jgi:hypothetical protein
VIVSCVMGYLVPTLSDSILVPSSKVEMSQKDAGEQVDMLTYTHTHTYARARMV